MQNLTDTRAAQIYYDDRYAGGYMQEWPDEKLRRVKEVIAGLHLPKRGVALDFGCGTGVFSQLLHEALQDWQIVGAELSLTALASARQRCPAVAFISTDDLRERKGAFDLVFTHHVLEHVSDLDQTVTELASLLRPDATMLHILPCGNPGSLEWKLCQLHRGGIDRSRGNRFFFEDPSHLRRLTSEEFRRAWERVGCRVVMMRFANQLSGALKYYSDEDLGRAASVAEPSRAVNASARARLWLWRMFFCGLWAARRPMASLRAKRRTGIRSGRDALIVSLSVIAYPVAFVVDALVRKLAAAEWDRRHDDARGTEMYVALSAHCT